MCSSVYLREHVLVMSCDAVMMSCDAVVMSHRSIWRQMAEEVFPPGRLHAAILQEDGGKTRLCLTSSSVMTSIGSLPLLHSGCCPKGCDQIASWIVVQAG